MTADLGTGDSAYFRLFMKPELIAKSDRVQISRANLYCRGSFFDLR